MAGVTANQRVTALDAVEGYSHRNSNAEFGLAPMLGCRVLATITLHMVADSTAS